MCNLYTLKRSAEEVASFFGLRTVGAAPNVPDDILPGYPGLVVREDAGERLLESMVWGFPLRLRTMKPDSKCGFQPKPAGYSDLKSAGVPT